MPLAITQQLHFRAKEINARIGLGDTSDPRMLEAARIANEEGIAQVSLVGAGSAFDVAAHEVDSGLVGLLRERSASISTDAEAADLIRKNELLYGAMLVAAGSLDGLVAGSISTTGDVIRAALRGIGLAPGHSVLSSMFLMAFPSIPDLREEFALGFADCAVIPDPTAEQLVDIAIASSETFRALTGQRSRTALLSFSTKGSAVTGSTEKMKAAYELLLARTSLEFDFDGELQFDAAFVPEIAAKKAAGSSLNGKANVFVFPNLDAGNIGYKIAERLGMGSAIGPIFQGLNKPMNDLSRGTSVSEIVTMIAITAIQSANGASAK